MEYFDDQFKLDEIKDNSSMELTTNQYIEFINPIQKDLEILKKYIELKLKKFFQGDKAEPRLDFPQFFYFPNHPDSSIPYVKFLTTFQLKPIEQIIFLTALAPHIKPQLFDCFFIQNKAIGRTFSEFGGIQSNGDAGFIPTLETLNFVLFESQGIGRGYLIDFFSGNHPLVQKRIISIEKIKDSSTTWSGKLKMDNDWVYFLLTGREKVPAFSSSFPAKPLVTSMGWDDLIVNQSIREELHHILAWGKLKKELRLEEKFTRTFQKGYKALFYGPPGTGKSLAAALLGKAMNLPVFRIDLSQLVSKYIGETEKNLSKVFNLAHEKDWILFFDEADSLFAKRTDITDSKDKYANQGTSYLLQRLEEYDGLILLASNLKPNIDKAFTRRFHSILHFTIPESNERLKLWKILLRDLPVNPEVDHLKLATKYEVSGASTQNAIQFAWINARKNNRQEILEIDLEAGLIRELAKEGKSVN